MVKRFKVDLKDRKILAELDWNARASNSELAKKVGLSKKAVEYRIKQLEKHGIIWGYSAVVNQLQMGYVTRKAWIKLQYMNTDVKRKMENYLRNSKVFGWSMWFEGEYDLGISSILRNSIDFSEELNNFFSKFRKNIRDKYYSETLAMEEFPWRFLLNSSREDFMNLSKDGELVVLDEGEKKVLTELLKNSRRPFVDIGKKTGLNYKTVKKKLEELKRKNILLGTRTLIDPYKLGMVWYKIYFRINYKKKDVLDILKKYLRKRKEVVYIVYDFFTDDFDVEILVPSHDVFLKFLEEIEDDLPDTIESYRHILLKNSIRYRQIKFE